MTLALLGAPALAGAVTCNHPTICNASALLADRACCGATSCTLDGVYTVSGQNCDLDFGARNVTMSGQLAIGPGTASIEANSLTVKGPLTAVGAKGDPGGGTLTITLSGVSGGPNPAALRVTGSTGGIDLSGFGAGGGTLTVQADGPIAIAGAGLDANGLEDAAGGGTFYLTTTSGGVTIDGDVLARGGVTGDAGTIRIVSAGDFELGPGNTISVTGGGFSEGLVDIEVGGNASLKLASAVQADGLAGSAASGGSIQIVADTISVLGDLTVVGATGGGVGDGGDGGDIELEARTGKLLLQRNTGGLLADAASGGDGGSITLVTDALTNTATGTDGTVTINAPVSAQGLGTTDGFSGGGSIEIDAAGDLHIQRPVNANGAGGAVSEIDITAVRDVTIEAPVTGNDPGGGGDLSISGHDITVGGSLLFQAPPSVDGGDGGTIALIADDDVSILKSNAVDVSGAGDADGGRIDVLAGRNIGVEFQGTIKADGGGFGGAGGQVFVTAGNGNRAGDLTINGEIDARGSSLNSSSSIDLEACSISITIGTIDSRGDPASFNTFVARKSLSLPGLAHLFAASSNLFKLTAPLVPGSTTIVPDPTVEQHPPCTGPNVPAGCLMPCPTCGDHIVQFPETCDPGATGDRCGTGCAHCQHESCTANPCLVADCDPVGGCLGTAKPEGTPCDNADLCDGHEICRAGACQQGTKLSCDDRNPCTDDTCIAATGCNHADRTQAPFPGCDDGNPCDGVETCVAGACVPGTPPVCTAPTVCNRATGNCDVIPCTPPDTTPCNDGNACTTDSCVACTTPPCASPFNCQSTVRADGASCADPDACNGAETCQGGHCTAGTPPDCDDGHFCTVDSCDPALSCQNQPTPGCCEADGECDDQDDCTADACVDHHCSNVPIPNCCQTPTDCDDGNPCDGVESCTAERCTPGTNLDDGTPCDDDTVCNGREQCQAGACVTTDPPPNCNSTDVCTDEFCDPVQSCITRAIPGCCHDDGECDDHDACTQDACSSDTHTCGHVAPDQSCRPCQLDTDCDPEGRCAGQACGADFKCTTVPLPCDDGNSHTSDRCTLDAQLHPKCAHPCLDAQACDDGKACNGTERCQAGSCLPGTDLDCNDHDLCTDDGCSELRSGCFHTKKVSFAGVTCVLDGVDAALTPAVPPDITAALKKKLTKSSGKARAKLLLAIAADQAGNVKKRVKMLHGTAALVKSMQKTVTKSVTKHKISEVLGATLEQLLGGGLDAVTAMLPPK